MKSFVYQNPVKVYFGKDQLGHLPKEIALYGSRVLLVYGGGSVKRIGIYERVMQALNSAGMTIVELSGVRPNPTIDSVREGVRLCRENQIEVVLALGGGSTIDASKWIAAGAKNDCDPWEMIDHAVHRPARGALPIVTVLTMAATGSEMNNGGVISNDVTHEKFGAKSDWIYPKASFLDPTLTYTVDRFQTAAGSADILNHVAETYFAPDDPMAFLDFVMESTMKTVVRYAPIALEKPEDYEARANLMWAASWAINGFVRADKTHVWSCHPMEHVLTAFHGITHGQGLAILMPRWLRYCMREDNLKRYVAFATQVMEVPAQASDSLTARKGLDALEDFLFVKLGLARNFTELGIDDRYFAQMAKMACEEKGVIHGFVDLEPADVETIYRMCL